MLIFIQKIKCEPGFTTDEVIQKWNAAKPKRKEFKEPVEAALVESLRLIKIFEKLEMKKISLEKKKVLMSTLIQMKEKIDSILKEI